MSLLQLSSTC